MVLPYLTGGQLMEDGLGRREHLVQIVVHREVVHVLKFVIFRN